MVFPRKKGYTKEQNLEFRNRQVPSIQEIDEMISKVNRIEPTPFFRSRAKALIALLEIFGKREMEIGRLRIKDLTQVGADLEIRFSLLKKRKRGLFQFLAYAKKHEPEMLSKPLPEIQLAWKTWQATEQGHKIQNSTSLQSVAMNDKYAVYIMEYLDLLQKTYPKVQFLFPSGRVCFEHGYIPYEDKHLSGRQILRIVHELDHDVWPHLLRNRKASQVARENGRTLMSVQAVKEALDLSSEATALEYLRRYVPQKQKSEG